MTRKIIGNDPASASSSHPRKDTPTSDCHALARRAFSRGDWEAAAHYYAQCEEQRAAELALINSVQEGLSSQIQMQEIYTLVGDKLRDTFDAQVVMISQYDSLTNMVYHRYAIERGRHLNLTQWSTIDSSRLRIVQTRKPYMINPEEINRLLKVGKMKIVPGTELPKTWLGVPMIVGDQVVGIVSLQNLDKENAFSDSDITLLSALTNSMSQSLENARLYNETQRLLKLLEAEMEIARQTQQSILPMRPPNHLGYDFGALIISARAVSGDFYDFIPFGRHKMGLVVGDVSDKGLHAALFMALTFSLLRAEAGRGEDPAGTLLNVNRYLLKMNASSMFVTLLFAVLDFRTGKLKYARAGHLPPLVLNNNRQWLDLPMDEGQPLGLFKEIKIDRQECTLPPGGLALLFSDGLTETTNPLGEELGLNRVRQHLMSYSGEGAQSICGRLWLEVQAYGQPIPQQDDFTAVIIKRE